MRRDTRAFEQLFKRNYSRLCGMAYQYLEDVEEARDVVNDVFEWAWAHFDALDMPTAEAYLGRAVRNRCLNLLEHRKVEAQFFLQNEMAVQEEEAGVPEEEERLMQQIEEACRRLPDKTRYVLSQCYYHRKRYKEVADELAITTDAVKKHIVKALKFLRESINKKGEI